MSSPENDTTLKYNIDAMLDRLHTAIFAPPDPDDEIVAILAEMSSEAFEALIQKVRERMEGLIEGRIVHFVLPAGRSEGEHRPAVIVKVWESHRAQGTVNLQVFTDYTNDFAQGPGSDGRLWATSVHYSEDKKPNTWHWVEKA